MLIRRVLCYNLPNSLVSCGVCKFSTNNKNAVLPPGSTLHRVSEHFTPLVEAQPDLDVAAMTHSIKRRGLTNVFQSGFLENLAQQRRRIRDFEKEIEKLETERVALHQESQEASKTGDAELQGHLRVASKRIKKEKSRVKELYRSLSFSAMETLLRLPNRLRGSESELSIGDWYRSRVLDTGNLRSNAVQAGRFEGSTIQKDCGTYFTGELASFSQEMERITASFRNETVAQLGVAPRRCSLSDFVRLPVADACAWTNSLEEVIQIEHTKDDLHKPKDSNRALINPHTRLCLVGSASLAAFVGSFFGCRLGAAATTNAMNADNGRDADNALPLPHFLASGKVFDPVNEKVSVYPFKETQQISYCALDWNEVSSEATFDNLAQVIGAFWSKTQPHWSLCLRSIPVEKLRRSEMARWSLVLVSSGQPDVEISTVSLLGDWVSRRAAFRTGDGVFPFMVFANVISFEGLLAAIRTSGAYLPVSL